MPLTPFHLGPGALFKAAGGSRFSFMVFGISQVLIDVEPLIGIIERRPVLHGPSHTVAGAFVIGIIAGAIGRPASEFILRLLRIGHHPLTWSVSFASAFVGTYSHIALDAIMHRDMRPLWPLAANNPLLGPISVEWLYWDCVISGAIAVLFMAGRNYISRTTR